LRIRQGGRYILVGYLNNPNCTFSDTIKFDPVECPDLLIPDAFSPNGDGVSDIWQLKGLGITEFDLTIYNAWGEVVFTSKDQKRSWDGMYRGKVAPVGTYKYLIKYKVDLGDRQYQENKTGVVTLVR
jgi:gliding motility-associated-like protein